MQVRFKVNLGSQDAEPLGLDFQQCQAGATLEVADEAGEWLIGHGIAEYQKSKSVVGAPQRPAIAEAESPSIQAATNPGGKAGNKHKES
jgi:hypothetical protein